MTDHQKRLNWVRVSGVGRPGREVPTWNGFRADGGCYCVQGVQYRSGQPHIYRAWLGATLLGAYLTANEAIAACEKHNATPTG